MRSDQLTLLPPDGPARTSPWRDVVLAWQAHVRASGERSSASWVFSVPGGSSERMSLASCRAREARTWEPSSGSWGNSGMGGPTECWTLVTSEWPSDGVECSLSDVLVTQPVPPRYYLSQRAASGILQRVAKRREGLPAPLTAALESVAGPKT